MAILFILSVLLIAMGTWALTRYPNLPGTMFYEPVSPTVLILSASMFMLVKLTMPKVPPLITRMRDFAGNYNYGIYLAHALVLYFLDDPFGISYKLCTPIISIPVTALICFILSLLLVWVISKLPFGKWVSG